MFKKITLKNGLRIIIVPEEAAQAVTVLVLSQTGSKYETKEINGISHFLEHMLFKGTKKKPTYLEVAETLDRVGGIYNAFTSEDYTGYFAKVEASQFNLAFDWVADIFLNSALPEEEIEKEKGVITEEINMVYDHPMHYIGSVMWPKLLYGDQPAGWSIAGSKETVANISRKKLLDYRAGRYVPQNTVLCVAGKVKTKVVESFAKKYFSKASSKESFLKPKVFEKQASPQCLLEYRKTDQTHICLGVRSYNIFHPQRYVLDVLGLILGGMMSSRLFVEVREKLGLAYYIRTEAEANPDTGYLVTQAGVENGRAEEAVKAILREYDKISKTKISLAEIKKAKSNLKGKLALLLEASDAQASFYGMQELLEKKILTPSQVFQKIDEVSVSGILKAARDVFRPDKLNLAVLGPFEDKEKFNKLLKL